MAKFRKVNLPAIQYRVAEGRLFLHMKSCFELLDLVAAVMSSKKGYGAINTSTSGLEVSSCYLATLPLHLVPGTAQAAGEQGLPYRLPRQKGRVLPGREAGTGRSPTRCWRTGGWVGSSASWRRGRTGADGSACSPCVSCSP